MYASQNRWHELYAELRANFKDQMQKKKKKKRYFCLKIIKLWIWFTYPGLYMLKRKLKTKC